VLLSLQRMKSIRTMDAPGMTMTVEAGTVLADAQAAAAEARRALASDPGKLRRLDAAIKDLKVEG